MSKNIYKERIKGLAVWWVILIIVAIIVVVAVVLSFILPKEPKEPPPVSQEPITQCIGTIQAVEDNVVTINCEQHRNESFSQDEIFAVAITETTEGCIPQEAMFDKVEEGEDYVVMRPKAIKPTKDMQQELNPEEMEVGASLMAVSHTDMNKTDTFTATLACYYPKEGE